MKVSRGSGRSRITMVLTAAPSPRARRASARFFSAASFSRSTFANSAARSFFCSLVRLSGLARRARRSGVSLASDAALPSSESSHATCRFAVAAVILAREVFASSMAFTFAGSGSVKNSSPSATSRVAPVLLMSVPWLKKAKSSKYSRWVMGSYLWVWHWAQPRVSPSQTAPVVLMRSTTSSLRNCSGSVPPS